MAKKFIDSIQVGGYPAGQFAGGYIYSMNMEQGYAEQVNKLTLEIVFDGNQNSEPALPTKNFQNAFSISIGSLNLPQMYFLSHSFSASAGQRTLSVTFVDNSVKLDRYYVGLKKRHGNTSSGNLILVGAEIPNLNEPCNAGEIKYRFQDLIGAIRSVIDVGGTFVNYPNIYLNYSGTMRQVLSNIGSDFAFSFYWDVFQNKLVLVDLARPVNLAGIEGVITSNFSGGSMPIADYKKEESLEGTYMKGSSNFLVKNGGVKEFNWSQWSTTRYVHISPNISDLTVCFLSSVNPTLRTLHLLSQGRYEAAGVYNFNAFNSFTFRYFSEIFRSFVLEVSARGFPHVYGSCDVVDSEGEKYWSQVEANEYEKYGRFYKLSTLVNIAPNICTPDYSKTITVNKWPGGTEIANDRWGSSSKPDFERNPNTTVEYWLPSNLDPIFLPVSDDLADQLFYYAKSIGVTSNDFNLRGKTLIAFPKITVSRRRGVNPNEEDFLPPTYENSNPVQDECFSCIGQRSQRQITSEFTLSEPGRGLNSKNCETVEVTTPGGGWLRGYLPSTDWYLGYVKVDVSEKFNDSASFGISQGSSSVPDSVMNYEHSAKDLTNENQNSQTIPGAANPSISEQPLKNISFKIIGTDFTPLRAYMNPENGLSNFSIYLDDNGIYSSFVFQNRPPIPPSSEEVMNTVAARKTALIG